MSLETDFIQVFSESDSLKSPERKVYYKELVAFSREWLLGMPIDAAQHFKRLFFEGYLPANRGALGASEPFLICLSAPALDKDYVISVFNQYADHCAYNVVSMWRVHFDGRDRAVSPDIISRFSFIVESLGHESAIWLYGNRNNRHYLYLGFYAVLFGSLCRGLGVSHCIGLSMVESAESGFMRYVEDAACAENLAYLTKQLNSIFSGEMEDPEQCYNDPFLVGFAERFFTGQLPEALHGFCQNIYAAVPPSQRITFKDGKIVYVE
jgi:hypothetical protein